MIREHKQPLIVASIVGMLFAVTASSCHGEKPHSWSAKTAYTRIVASTKEESNYDLNRDLFTQQLPGGEPVRLTDWARHPLLDKGMFAPQWSPDGNSILFMGHLKNHKPVMPQNNWPSYPWIVDVRTRTPKLVGQTKDSWYLNAEWLPDGQKIVARVVIGKHPQFYYHMDLRDTYVMSNGETRLVVIDSRTMKERIVRRNLGTDKFYVSPKSQQVILYEHGNNRFTVIDLVSGKSRTLCKSSGIDAAAISPDGKRLAYYHKGVLRVCNIQTGKVQVLYNACDIHDSGGLLFWSPNGMRIVVRHSSSNIASIDPPVASSTSYLTLVNAKSGKFRLLLEDARDIPIGWTNDSENILLQREEKAGGVFPCDTKTLLTAYPTSTTSAELSPIDMVGYLGSIDVFMVPK